MKKKEICCPSADVKSYGRVVSALSEWCCNLCEYNYLGWRTYNTNLEIMG